jgi:probable HAF family extracellular repeat protein
MCRLSYINRLLAAFATLTTFFIADLSAQTTYSIRALRPSGASFVDAHAGVNSVGEVAGRFVTTDSFAYLWTNGAFHKLGRGMAYGSNNLGQVVGVSPSTNHATLWKNGQAIDLGTLSAGGSSVAMGINDNGTVVGYDQTTTGTTHAFRWTPSSGMKYLSDLGGGSSQATHINLHGEIVGWATDTSNRPRTVVWKSGKIYDLIIPDVDHSKRNGVNDSGEVIAQNLVSNGTTLGLIITSAGGGTIDVLPNFNNNVATAINGPGTVVGYDFDSQGNTRPFACFNRNVFDLNTLIPKSAQTKWLLQVAQGVNDQGQIVGYGTYNGLSAAFLLTPTGAVQNASCF